MLNASQLLFGAGRRLFSVGLLLLRVEEASFLQRCVLGVLGEPNEKTAFEDRVGYSKQQKNIVYNKKKNVC